MAEEERPIVAFLGPEASYTHQATLSFFPKSTVTISPQVTIEDVFTAVQTGTAYRGVVPFENSSNGSVVFTLDLFADLAKKHADILVCGEAYVSVKHCLLGHLPQNPTSPASSSSKDAKDGEPTCDLNHIKTLYSHPQAWGQCKAFLDTYLKGVERRDVSSTSRAAELVAQDTSGASAALSSIIAADTFHLDVLAQTINDRVGNTTRFLVLRRKADDTTTTTLTQTSSSDHDSRNWKSLVTFTVDHANPGALAHCLAAFEKYGLNLTAINTRPSGVRNWNYIFFVEFKGRMEEGNEGCRVNQALRDLEKVCRGYRWLGSWENRLEEGQ